MFIKSFKTSKVELIVLIMGLVVFIATLCYIFLPKNNSERTSANNVTSITQILVNAQNADDRIKFLSQFGWEVDPEPLDVRDVIIPAEFDENYEEYNAIQKPLGFDLSKYKGRMAKKWVYTITNYPNISNNVTATLLIVDGKVIGGDISSTGAKKFTHSFLMSAENSRMSDSDKK
ncbi:MAG: DUF4830 domain-containing protein [Acutalibacteraceae bacterium]